MKISINKLHIFFLMVFIAIALWFFHKEINAASQKVFWLDEEFVLGRISQDLPIPMILHGEWGQMSPAPLDYIALHGVEQFKEHIGTLGLPDTVFYRLYTIFFNFISGLLIVTALSIHIKNRSLNGLFYFFQMSLLTLGLIFYYFHPMNLHYSIETRPYALWNSLYFSLLCLWMFYPNYKRLLLILMIALAATMTSSIFQLLSLALSFSIVLLCYQENILHVLIKALKLFLLPLCIVAYYIYSHIHEQWNWDKERSVTLFVHYWIEHPMVPILCIIAIFKTFRRKEYLGHTIAFSGFLKLYILAPVIMYLTIKRGVYFTPRQYIYYNLIYPVFCIHLALTLPMYFNKQFKPRFKAWVYALLALVLGLIFSLQFIFMNDPKLQMIKINDIMPRDYSSLIHAANNGTKFDRAAMEQYLQYYDLLIKYIPKRPDAYGMQGYCYYQLGETQKAISSYQKASVFAPNILWYPLNLASIYFNQGQYEKSIEWINNFKNYDLRQNAEFVLSSQIYLPIRSAYLSQYNQPIISQITSGYLKALELIVMSHFHLKHYPLVLNLCHNALREGPGDPEFFNYYALLSFEALRTGHDPSEQNKQQQIALQIF